MPKDAGSIPATSTDATHTLLCAFSTLRNFKFQSVESAVELAIYLIFLLYSYLTLVNSSITVIQFFACDDLGGIH